MKEIAAFLDEIDKYDSRFLKGIVSILEPHIVEKNGCIVIDSKGLSGFDLKVYHDRTEAEATLNHFHFDGSKLKKHILLIARNWISVLQTTFPDKDFLFYVEKGVILRFHQIRSTEPPWHDIDNAKYLLKENILVFFVRSQKELAGGTTR